MKGSVHEVTITGLTNQGEGVGRLDDGRAVFVPYVAPGDAVEVSLIQSKKRFARGHLETILTPGEGRAQPRCRHFQSCGGCTWQHLRYETQEHWKTQIVRDALERLAKFSELPEILFRPAKQPYRLRTRARLQVSPQKQPGYFQRGSKRILEVNECLVLSEELQELLLLLRQQLPSLPLQVAEVCLLSNEAGEVVFSLHSDRWDSLKPFQEQQWILWCQELQQSMSSLLGMQFWCKGHLAAHWGQSWLMAEGSPLRYAPADFAQASFAMNQQLIEDVLEFHGITEATEVLELYAGRGNFSLPLVKAGCRVQALEYSKDAIAEGRRAAEELGLSEQLQWKRWNDEQDELSLLSQPQMVLLDPPRRGVEAGILQQLLELDAPWMVYVSCDPATFARDLKVLCEQVYEIQQLRVVDLMPQTPHVESIVLLKRRS